MYAEMPEESKKLFEAGQQQSSISWESTAIVVYSRSSVRLHIRGGTTQPGRKTIIANMVLI